jgi:hypothetical protein
MTKAATPPRWFHNWRAATPPVVHDPADLGTAFGLDLSLNEIAHEPPAHAMPVARSAGWVSRLSLRRKPSA